METQLRDAFLAEGIDLRGSAHDDIVIEGDQPTLRHLRAVCASPTDAAVASPLPTVGAVESVSTCEVVQATAVAQLVGCL
jgi:hypothetical protein